MTFVPKSQQNVVVNFGKFDATLARGYAFNLDLTLTLKVCLKAMTGGKREVSDHGGVKFEADDWPEADWKTFCETYQSEGEKFWDNSFWLWHLLPSWNELDYNYTHAHSACVQGTLVWTPPWVHVPTTQSSGCAYRTTVKDCVVRPAVNCRFKLQLVTKPELAHTTIEVVYVTKKKSDGSAVATNMDFRSNAGLYDSADLKPKTLTLTTSDGEAVTVTKKTHLHEIGHSLGLEHSGVSSAEEACKLSGDNNSGACYGVNKDTIQNIMGWGTELSLREALPWQTALGQLTSTLPALWLVSRSFRPAQIEVKSTFEFERRGTGWGM
jgi:hypothetical protein